MKTKGVSALFGVLMSVSISCTSWALNISASDALQGVGVGPGLQGSFWHTPSGATNWYNIAPTLAYLDTHPTSDGTFTATKIGYGASDESPIQTFLQADGGSYVGPNVNTGDSILKLSGFIDITSPGTINFRSDHDDCVQLKIGSELLYSVGILGVAENSATFTQTGFYSIELVYSNTYWPPPTGSGGLSLLMDTGSGYQLVPTSMLYKGTEPVPEPATMFLMGTGLIGLIGAYRRKNA